MKRKIIFLVILFSVILVGCNAAVNMRDKVIGISSGKFLFQDGNMTTIYNADIDLVWNACEKTIKDLKGSAIQKERKISRGTITAVVQDEKVKMSIEYITKGSTSVSVFVGVVGNNMASRLIHDKIAHNLAASPP